MLIKNALWIYFPSDSPPVLFDSYLLVGRYIKSINNALYLEISAGNTDALYLHNFYPVTLIDTNYNKDTEYLSVESITLNKTLLTATIRGVTLCYMKTQVFLK